MTVLLEGGPLDQLTWLEFVCAEKIAEQDGHVSLPGWVVLEEGDGTHAW